MRKGANMSQSSPDIKKQLSPYSLSGSVILLLGVLLYIMTALFDLTAVPTTILRILAGICLAAATLLGFLAVRQIRSSPEQYSSMRLSVFLLLFTPIIVLDLLLFILGWALLAGIISSSLVPLAWLVIVILVDYGVVRLTWNRAIQ
jgi:hypothetical protein